MKTTKLVTDSVSGKKSEFENKLACKPKQKKSTRILHEKAGVQPKTEESTEDYKKLFKIEMDAKNQVYAFILGSGLLHEFAEFSKLSQ
jgi:hypothetical protein